MPVSLNRLYQVDNVEWNIEIAGSEDQQKTNTGDGCVGSIVPIPVHLFSGYGRQRVELVGGNVGGQRGCAVSVFYTKLEQASFPFSTAG